MTTLTDFKRGDTRKYKMIFKDATGAAIDISGLELRFTMKLKGSEADPDSQAAIAKVITFPNDADSQAGIGQLVLTSDDTNIDVDTYSYDFQQVVPGTNPPDVTTLGSGVVKVLQDVTQDDE